MSEVGVKHRRRSLAEVEVLVAEFESSGLARASFRQQRGLVVGTLDKYRQRVHGGRQSKGRAFVPVELVPSTALDVHNVAGRDGALVVELGSGRRIEVCRERSVKRILRAQAVGGILLSWVMTEKKPFSIDVH